MKKLVTYLLLIACFEGFISATPGLCDKHRNPSNIINHNISIKEEFTQPEDINSEIHPLNILSFRIN